MNKTVWSNFNNISSFFYNSEESIIICCLLEEILIYPYLFKSSLISVFINEFPLILDKTLIMNI